MNNKKILMSFVCVLFVFVYTIFNGNIISYAHNVNSDYELNEDITEDADSEEYYTEDEYDIEEEKVDTYYKKDENSYPVINVEETDDEDYFVQSSSNITPIKSHNICLHDYIGIDNYIKYFRGYCTSSISSYIDGIENGYQRLEYVSVSPNLSGGNLYVEYYNNQFQLTNNIEINMELPIFGGYYCGNTYNYIVFGQSNFNEDNSVEVIRIVKYDKSWNRISSASLYGANTIYPFEAAALRMDESNGYLVIRTGHLMYAADDGNNHQANMTIIVRTNDMVITDNSEEDYLCLSGVFGYVSHSFNQFVKIDGETIVAVDHGDAYPRSVLVGKYKKGITTGRISNYDYYDLVEIPGECGDNTTGVQVGGFEISNTGYLVADSRCEYFNNTLDYDDYTYNVYVQYINKDFTQSNEIKLTDYVSKSDVTASNPYLIKLNDDCFLILWQKRTIEAQLIDRMTNGIYYTYLDGNGNKLGNGGYINNGSLSDCEPKLINGKVVWYVTNSWVLDGKPIFYSITPNTTSYTLTMSETPKSVTGITLDKSSITLNVKGTQTLNATISPADASDKTLTWTSSNTNVATVDANGKVTAKTVGTATITAKANDGSEKSATCTVTVKQPVTEITLDKSSITLNIYDSQYLFEKVTPSNASDKTITWTSSNTDVATVDKYGKVIAKSAGTATITAKANDGSGKSVTCTVTVKQPVTGITLDKRYITLDINDTQILNATVTPSNASDKTLTWTSSNTSVAIVDENGKVTAKSTGEATITVKANDGSINFSTCYVLVTTVKSEDKDDNKDITDSKKDDTKDTSTNTDNTDTQKDTSDATVKTVNMYRLYNPNSGEHFYTANVKEKDNLVSVGWRYEGIGWKAPVKSNTPVYRLYNKNAGDHHYTMSEKEKDNLVSLGWKYEGIGWYSDDAKSVPLYRQYNPNAKAGSHNYTTSKSENDMLVGVGWKGEGVGWYGVK